MTLTSNIHLGIVGWSNATYAIGSRRSNAGNAYEVVSGGTSTSPPTGTGSSINNGGTAVWKYLTAVDFTTWQAHANSFTSAGQPVVGLFWRSGGVITATLGTPIVHLTGHTTSGTNTITYKPAPGESFKDVYIASPTTPLAYNGSKGVAFSCPTSGNSPTNYIWIDDSNVILEGIQFVDPVSTSGCSIIGGSGASVTIRQCIIDGYSQSGGALIVGIGGANLTFVNNLIVGRNTSPTSGLVGVSGATGAVVANNTFVHTTLVSGQLALDAGANGTNASCTSTNNIFYNYNIVYAGSGGAGTTPWLSTNCAFSASSFSLSNAGTNSGGSIFGITSGATFVTFSTDLNPKAGANILNAGATDTTDIPSAVDIFGNSRPQGTNWDIGAVERLAGTIVTRDFVFALEIMQTNPTNLASPWEAIYSSEFGGGASVFAADSTFSVDWKATKNVSVSVPADWRGTFTAGASNSDAIIPLEILETLPSMFDPWGGFAPGDFGPGPFTIDPRFPIEWRQGAPTATRDVGIGIEWRSGITKDMAFSAEVLQSHPHLNVPFTSEFTDEVGEGPYTLIPAPFPIEWRVGTGFFVSAAIPIEFGTSVSRSINSSIDTKLSVLRDFVVNADWGKSTSGITSTIIAPLEWRSSIRSDVAASADWTRVLSVQMPMAGAEWRSVVQASTTGNADWRSAIVADSGGAIEYRASIISTVTWPMAFSHGMQVDVPLSVAASANGQWTMVSHLGWGGTVSKSDTMQAEWGRIATSGTLLSIGVEWAATIRADATGLIDRKSSVVANSSVAISSLASVRRDISGSTDFKATFLRAFIAPVEFGHETQTRSVDLTFAIEFSATITSSMRAALEYRKTKHHFGAQLEPDHWERDHEP